MKDALEGTKNFQLQDLSAESIRKNIQHTKDYKTLRLLRQALWKEYGDALAAGRMMAMTRVWQGITQNSGSFYQLMKRPEYAAFVFTKPVKQDMQERMLLELSLDRIEDLLLAQTVSVMVDKETGQETRVITDPKGAKVQFEIYRHLDERVQGGIMKQVSVKSEQKSLNMNLNQTSTTTTIETINVSEVTKMEELNKQLLELREKTKDILEVAPQLEHIRDDDE